MEPSGVRRPGAAGDTATLADLESLAGQGDSFAVEAGPGTGKTRLAVSVAVRALTAIEDRPPAGFWAPVLVLTPDRRRAALIDRAVTEHLSRAEGNGGSAALLDGPGSHRLVRSVNSYANLVTGLWSIERLEPVPRIPFVSGADEDAWATRFLATADLDLPDAMRASPGLRMELRNLMARAGEHGILPDDLVKLGEQHGRPLWQAAGRAFQLYAGDDAFGPGASHADTARLPRIAAGLLGQWDDDCERLGLTVDVPVPRVLIVDDAQDLTPSGAVLVAAAARLAQQTIILGSPATAAAAFRGGNPGTGGMLAVELGIPMYHLDRNLGSTPAVARVSEEIGGWLTPSLSQGSEMAGLSTRSAGAKEGALPSGVGSGSVFVQLAPTETGRDTMIAQTLRRYHLLSGVAWDQMAVLVRTASQVEPVRRRLTRADIPLQNADRPVQLASVPVCAALLELLVLGAQADPERSEESREEQLQQGALALLDSPLVAADSLAVFRLIRDLRASTGQGALKAVDLLQMDRKDLLKASSGSPSREELLERVRVARSLWAAKETAAAASPETGLWELWHRAGLAEPLRRRAMRVPALPGGTGSERGGWSSRADAAVASEELDAVTALFRKADLWAQKLADSDSSHEATALDFAKQELAQTVASDSLVRGGIPSSGVAVMTASAAAGHRWQVVCIAGPQAGEWPRAGGDTFGRPGELRVLAEDARERGWVPQTPIEPFVPDPGLVRAVGGVAQVRADEAALLNLAVSRASDALHFFAVEGPEQAPSLFLNQLMESGAVRQANPVGTESYAGLDLDSFIASLRRNAADPSSSESQRTDASRVLALLALEGIGAADPAQWGVTGSISSDAPLIDAGPLRLSPSKIADAQACTLKWFLGSVQLADLDIGEQQGRYSGAALGTLVHEIAEELPQGSYQQLMTALEEKWEQYGFERETYWGRRRWEQAKRQIGRLSTHVSTWKGEVLTEVSMQYQIGPAVVSGRIDRIEVGEDGTARVVDIKTGKPVSEKQAAENPQLTAYQLGLQELGYTSGGAALLQLKEEKRTPLVVQEPLDAGGLQEAREHLAGLAGTLAQAAFEPDDSNPSICMFCQFQAVCPAKDHSARSTE